MIYLPLWYNTKDYRYRSPDSIYIYTHYSVRGTAGFQIFPLIAELSSSISRLFGVLQPSSDRQFATIESSSIALGRIRRPCAITKRFDPERFVPLSNTKSCTLDIYDAIRTERAKLDRFVSRLIRTPSSETKIRPLFVRRRFVRNLNATVFHIPAARPLTVELTKKTNESRGRFNNIRLITDNLFIRGD